MSVYFAAAGRYVKVGYSADPVRRMGTLLLHAERPDDLPRDADVDLLGWIPGDRRVEKMLHARFGSQWVEGEWFTLDHAAVRDVIWSDPCGIDFQRMSALAVFYALKHPGVTRDDIAAVGLPVMGRRVEDVVRSGSLSLLGGVA